MISKLKVACLVLIWALGFGNGYCYDILQLKKINQIDGAIIGQEKEYFYCISSFCFGSDGKIFMADSGLNKVLVFDKEGKSIGAIGKKGQGPGEFSGGPMGPLLDITLGNNGLLYVTDPGNQRISVFKEDGAYLRTYKMNERLKDCPVVNRGGDLYLLSSRAVGNLIRRYDRDMVLKATFLDAHAHATSRYFPDFKSGNWFSGSELRKVLTREDALIACSNLALKIFVFDSKDRLIRSFDIANDVFLRDFDERVKKLRTQKTLPGTTGASILPFFLHLDYEGNIYLGYWNISIGKNFELFRYSQSGELQRIYRFSDKVSGPFGTDRMGRLYGLGADRASLSIYEPIPNK